MALTRREILEELSRLGFTQFEELKKACREYEAFWAKLLNRRAVN